MLRRARRPKMIAQMRNAIDSVDLQFAHAREHALSATSHKAGASRRRRDEHIDWERPHKDAARLG
jgi:hypothetical protein